MVKMHRASALCAAALLAVNLAAPASAADQLGTSTTFQQVLLVDGKSNVPALTFQYAIAPGAAITAADGRMAVTSPDTASGVTGAPVIGSAVYTPNHATVTAVDGVAIAPGKKAAVETLTVDFSNVTFEEPGIYRWVISEVSSGQQGVEYDTQLASSERSTPKQRVLDVYVSNQDGRLFVEAYALHDNTDDIPTGEGNGSASVSSDGERLRDKSYGFVNEYITHDLCLSNTALGNQASRQKYFRYDVAIEHAGANTKLNVDWSDSDGAQDPIQSSSTIYTSAEMKAANTADDDPAMSGSQWATDADGSVTKTIYLRSGQTVRVTGLADGAKYSITEAPEDYKVFHRDNWPAPGTSLPALMSTPMHGFIAGAEVSDTVGMDGSDTVEFLNVRTGHVPTGVLLTLAPFLGATVAAAAGITVIARKRYQG